MKCPDCNSTLIQKSKTDASCPLCDYHINKECMELDKKVKLIAEEMMASMEPGKEYILESDSEWLRRNKIRILSYDF